MALLPEHALNVVLHSPTCIASGPSIAIEICVEAHTLFLAVRTARCQRYRLPSRRATYRRRGQAALRTKVKLNDRVPHTRLVRRRGDATAAAAAKAGGRARADAGRTSPDGRRPLRLAEATAGGEMFALVCACFVRSI
jgi:hypothetical protein